MYKERGDAIANLTNRTIRTTSFDYPKMYSANIDNCQRLGHRVSLRFKSILCLVLGILGWKDGVLSTSGKDIPV